MNLHLKSRFQDYGVASLYPSLADSPHPTLVILAAGAMKPLNLLLIDASECAIINGQFHTHASE